MNNQEILTKVATHLLKQNEACVDGETAQCLYKYFGLSCAIGCLIPDELYDESMERQPVEIVLFGYPKLTKYLDLQKRGTKLLGDLQGVHDAFNPDEWLKQLENTAKHYDLDVPKGIKNGHCNRASCREPGAVWYNPSTRAYYCKKCALLINKSERQMLCTLEDD